MGNDESSNPPVVPRYVEVLGEAIRDFARRRCGRPVPTRKDGLEYDGYLKESSRIDGMLKIFDHIDRQSSEFARIVFLLLTMRNDRDHSWVVYWVSGQWI